MSDYELILVAGLLLAAGLAAAKVADQVRVPGLLLFLGLGMLIGSEGVAQVEFTDAELTRTLGTIGLHPDSVRGRSRGRLERDPPGDRNRDVAGDGRHDPHRGDRRRRGNPPDRPRHPRGPDHRCRGRGDRLGGDLRRPPRFAPASPPCARARGRVRPQRPESPCCSSPGSSNGSRCPTTAPPT